ncbi:MAG: hypothetical protein NTV52_10210 [Acidobacteria bacterium]|nr:hypothetical protein [Acidobacteriota bacterium]
MKNFRLPLPERTYTTLVREAIDVWLKDQTRKARHNAIADYAAEWAGSELDLDHELESAGVEHLVKTSKARKRTPARSKWIAVLS